MIRIYLRLSMLLVALMWWQILPAQALDLKGVGDPTRPPAKLQARRGTASEPEMSASEVEAAEAASAAAAAAANATNLSAIRYDMAKNEGIALINDDWVRVGDKVKSLHVVSITQDMVVLSGAKGIRKLTLFADPGEDVGKPARSARRGRKEKK